METFDIREEIIHFTKVGENNNLRQILLTEFNFLSEKEILLLLYKIQKITKSNSVTMQWLLEAMRELVREQYGTTLYLNL